MTLFKCLLPGPPAVHYGQRIPCSPLLGLSKLQQSHLQNGSNNTIYPVELLWGLNNKLKLSIMCAGLLAYNISKILIVLTLIFLSQTLFI